MRVGCASTESDLETLSKIVNETDLSKFQVKNILKRHDLFEYMDFSTDTIPLRRIELIFENEKLISVVKEW